MKRRKKNRDLFMRDFFYKNRKGFLLAEETLKIIIAVIAIGFLAYFLVSLYFSAKTSQDLTQAKTTLPFLMNGIKNGETSIVIYNPKWVLGTWPHTVITHFLFFTTGINSNSPQTCKNLGLSTCICLCPSDSQDDCDSKGICVNNEGYLISGNSITIDNPPITLNIDKTKKIISKQ